MPLVTGMEVDISPSKIPPTAPQSGGSAGTQALLICSKVWKIL